MRIRDAQTERFLMDLHGIFYELPAQICDGRHFADSPDQQAFAHRAGFLLLARIVCAGGRPN